MNKLTKRIEQLTTAQIIELLNKSWNEYGGEAVREIAFDIFEDRHGGGYADRLYSEIWHANEKPYARATIQYRAYNPEGFRYSVQLWTIDPRGGYSYAGNGKSFPNNIAADRYAREMARTIKYESPAI